MSAEGRLELPADCARRYEAVRLLGTGGFGAAVLAFDRELSRSVVVKVLFGAEPDVVARFTREARVTANLHHENVVKVLDHGADAGVPWIVYEYVEGRTLRQRLDEGRVGVAEAVEVVRQVARALEAAHARGIVHRDVKPENVLEEAGHRYRLIDFGIAKGGSGHTVETAAGTVLGSPGYLSPEAISGAAVDARSDLYALGVLFFELLTGRPPFISASAMQVLTAHLNDAPPGVRRFSPDVTPALEALVGRCLAKKPEDRIPSAAALQEELARAIDAPAATRVGPTAAIDRSVGRLPPRAHQGTRQIERADASASGIAAAGRSNVVTVQHAKRAITLAPGLRVPGAALAAGAALVAALALVTAGAMTRRAPHSAPSPTRQPVATPSALDAAEREDVSARVAAIYERISARTQRRIARMGQLLAEPGRMAQGADLSKQLVRECFEDFHYLDDWLRRLDERFAGGPAPPDRPLSLRARAKRYTILAYLADMSGEVRLAELAKLDPALHKALAGCQGDRCFRLFADYLAHLPGTLAACADDANLHTSLPELVDDHVQIGRTVHAYPWCAEFERLKERRVKQSQDALLAAATRPGPLGVLSKLAERAWDRSERPMFRHNLKASRAEAAALLADQNWLAASIREDILRIAFKEN